MSLYQDNILFHARQPRNRGYLEEPRKWGRATNASCGDALELTVRLSPEGVIEACMFEGVGCALSQASASMMTEAVRGKTAGQVLAMGEGDVVEWLGTNPGTLRVACAVLPLKALQQGVGVWIKDSS
jgi:nitrogen fixation NifU-like protein